MNKKLVQISKCIAVLRKTRADMPLQQASMFLLVAMNEGITLSEIAEALETTPQSASRNSHMLSKNGVLHGKTKGLELISVAPSLYERRKYACHLTEKGHKVIEEMLAAID